MSKVQFYKFTADWCPPCKNFKPTFDTVMAKYPDANPVVVDVDAQPELAEQYEIKNIPAVVAVGANGKILSRMLGAKSEDMFEDWVETALNEARG